MTNISPAYHLYKKLQSSLTSKIFKVSIADDEELLKSNWSQFVTFCLISFGNVVRIFVTDSWRNDPVVIAAMLLPIFHFFLCGAHKKVFNWGLTMFISFHPVYCLWSPEYALKSAVRSMTLCLIFWGIIKDPLLFSLAAGSDLIFLNTITKWTLINTFPQYSPDNLLHTFMETLNISWIFSGIILLRSLLELMVMNNDLKNANLREKEANNQLKTFIFSVSHELRNPINSLLGSLSLALEEDLPPGVHKLLSTCKVCTELLLQLINNLLDTGKAGLGTLEVQERPTHIKEAILKVWKIVRELIKNKNLTGILKIDESIPETLMIDPYRLAQVLLNLAGNAVKFTSQGTITIHVIWLPNQEAVSKEHFEPVPYDNEDEEGLYEKEEHFYRIWQKTIDFTTTDEKDPVLPQSLTSLDEPIQKGVLKIIVKDTGCGMPSSALSKLFQKFSQVSTAPETRQVGTGLGLYITKEIIQKMRGEIRVYSKEITGSTFIACFPTISCPSSEGLTRNRPEVERVLRRRKLKVIVADNVQYNITLFKDYLSKIDAEVMVAKDGEEALDLYINNHRGGTKIDVVISDIDMPRYDGKILCKRLRFYETLAGINKCWIMIISGNDNPSIVRELLNKEGEYRADLFLKKPISYEDFLFSIAKNFV